MLTPAERAWLVGVVRPSEAWFFVLDSENVPTGEPQVGGGTDLRIRILALAMLDDDREAPLAVSVPELWLLDATLLRYDLRMAKLPDGQPLLTLARKIWGTLLAVYDSALPVYLRKEYRDGKPVEHEPEPGDGPDPDARDAIAGAEALLRPRDDKGAG